MHIPPRYAAALCLALLAIAPGARGQNMDYSAAYRQSLAQRPNMSGVGSNQYLYNRYFRNNPAVSPWATGAVLGGGDAGINYSTVRQEQSYRRSNAIAQAQYVQQRKLQGNVGYTVSPGAGYLGAAPGSGMQKPVPAGTRSSVGRTPGAYQNHWYGGWAR